MAFPFCRSLIPAEQAQELLQVSGWFTEGVSHWLDTFSGQIAQLALNIEIQILAEHEHHVFVVWLPKDSPESNTIEGH
jgi:hypothetical protein